MPSVHDVVVVPLSIDHWDALSALFETSAGVNGCWCMWPRREPMTHRPDPVGNKGEMKTLLIAGEVPGLVALSGERAIGWCAFGPRSRYPQYENEDEIEPAWAIPCLYIERSADRALVGRVLIEAAAELATSSGAVALDGPPSWWLSGDADAVASVTALFLANGVGRVGTGARMPKLRRLLRG